VRRFEGKKMADKTGQAALIKKTTECVELSIKILIDLIAISVTPEQGGLN